MFQPPYPYREPPPFHERMAVPPLPLIHFLQVPSINEETVERDLIRFYRRLIYTEFKKDIKSRDVRFLRNVPEAYRMDRLSDNTFDHPGMRCAYIFLNTPCFSNVVAYHFRVLLDTNLFISQKVLREECLSVCCLQGGPAPELLAIVKVVEMFLQFQALRPKVIKATVVDIDGGWRKTAEWIEQNWNNLFDTSLVQLQLSFVQADLTTPMCSRVREAVRSADVVTMAVFGTYNRVDIPFQEIIDCLPVEGVLFGCFDALGQLEHDHRLENIYNNEYVYKMSNPIIGEYMESYPQYHNERHPTKEKRSKVIAIKKVR